MVERSREALLRFIAAGGRVVIATGRAEGSALPYYDRLGLSGGAILYNGAMTVDLSTDRVLRSSSLSPAAWRTIGEVLENLPPGVFPVVFSEGRALALHDEPELREYARHDGIALHRPPDGWAGLSAALITKVMLIGAVDRLDGLRVEGTSMVRSEDSFLELLPEGATKGAALRAFAAAEGVPLEAVGDGHPDVRARAGLVVGSCADGAVADLVDHAMALN